MLFATLLPVLSAASAAYAAIYDIQVGGPTGALTFSPEAIVSVSMHRAPLALTTPPTVCPAW